MSNLRIPRRLVTAMAAGLIACIVSALYGAVPALALGPSEGTQVPGAAVPAGSYPSGAPFYSGQTLQVSIPPNSHLQPLLRVNILECSDPGGTAANLPTSVSECDGDTIQGDTVLIQHDGSIDYKKYTVYSLPNVAVLEEPADSLPVCNQHHECVLYIGQNQENFRAPHFFSEPFFVYPTRAEALAAPRAAASGGGNTLFIVVPIVAVILVGAAFFYVRMRRSPVSARRP